VLAVCGIERCVVAATWGTKFVVCFVSSGDDLKCSLSPECLVGEIGGSHSLLGCDSFGATYCWQFEGSEFFVFSTADPGGQSGRSELLLSAALHSSRVVPLSVMTVAPVGLAHPGHVKIAGLEELTVENQVIVPC
jgi:hypothetical protein